MSVHSPSRFSRLKTFPAESRRSDDASATHNVVHRLRSRIAQAKQLGFTVRTEWLDNEQASWCVLAGKCLIFLDLGATAQEQLQQLNETLESCVEYGYGLESAPREHAPSGRQAA